MVHSCHDRRTAVTGIVPSSPTPKNASIVDHDSVTCHVSKDEKWKAVLVDTIFLYLFFVSYVYASPFRSAKQRLNGRFCIKIQSLQQKSPLPFCTALPSTEDVVLCKKS